MSKNKELIIQGGVSLGRATYVSFEARYRGLSIEDVWEEIEEEVGMSKEDIEKAIEERERPEEEV